MPFKSQAQIRKFRELVKQGSMTQAEFDKWHSETPDAKKLPERVPAPVSRKFIRRTQK